MRDVSVTRCSRYIRVTLCACIFISMKKKGEHTLSLDPNGVGVLLTSLCTYVSMQPSVCQRMIPGLYILSLCSSNCIQATAHNIDQYVWSEGYWWICCLVFIWHLLVFIYAPVSRECVTNTVFWGSVLCLGVFFFCVFVLFPDSRVRICLPMSACSFMCLSFHSASFWVWWEVSVPHFVSCKNFPQKVSIVALHVR